MPVHPRCRLVAIRSPASSRLDQILANLISNAAKYGGGVDTIDVTDRARRAIGIPRPPLRPFRPRRITAGKAPAPAWASTSSANSPAPTVETYATAPHPGEGRSS
ncbi:hypothetical protein Aca07nite_48090 [Actinoplanes capillaceus]|uniref:Histidine kinase-, DNA gyrase B-, and HSP90-like ATPase n=1 Tax=Actinoplanes campanulatus TaxID=113559 RepID=A0ABQ3WMU2_9ACTN|nr:hypothetical protein Aca07nite_48090 [Actinoplanes capillaceus]